GPGPVAEPPALVPAPRLRVRRRGAVPGRPAHGSYDATRADRRRGRRLRRSAPRLPLPERNRMTTRRLTLVAIACTLAAGCGGSSKSGFPTIQAARTFALADFTPSA